MAKKKNAPKASKISIRSTQVEFELYPDDPNFPRQRDAIMALADVGWCMILHDQDEREDSTPKKPHYHVYAFFRNSRYLTALNGHIFGNKNHTNQTQVIEAKIPALRYLLHLDDPAKHRYRPDEVMFSGDDIEEEAVTAWNQCDSVPEADFGVISIMQWINSHEYVRYTDLVMWATLNGFYADLRRGASLFREVIREHNAFIEDTPDSYCNKSATAPDLTPFGRAFEDVTLPNPEKEG